jgi:hypothetical protein
MHNDNEFEYSPNPKLDFGIDWKSKGWLEVDETITQSDWIVDAPLVKSNEQVVNGVASLFVEGGEKDKTYVLTNTVTTSKGRRDSRIIKLFCRKR